MSSAAAQTTTGTISGRVLDAQALPLPGVTVIATSPNLQGTRETVSSANGDYILTLLFVKYVTDKAKSDPNSLIDVPAGGSFDDMVALKGDKEIGDKINKIIGKLAEANGLEKVIDLADFNDEEKLGRGKEMQDRLSKLVTIFADLDFRGSRAEGDDLLGDAAVAFLRRVAGQIDPTHQHETEDPGCANRDDLMDNSYAEVEFRHSNASRGEFVCRKPSVQR
jgi:type I restriction-modification system DNA methylase subunit